MILHSLHALLNTTRKSLLIPIENNKGFDPDFIKKQNRKLKIGIIDADLLDHGTRHPNLALEKIAGFCKELGHEVRLICSYDELNLGNPFFLAEQDFDVLSLSRVFKFTKIPQSIKMMINAGVMFYGGTGFLDDFKDDVELLPSLPSEVEHHMPDYTIYDEYIEKQTKGDAKLIKRDYDDYKSYSIGFTTRGCIRHCGFCVNRNLSHVFEWSPVSEFIDESRPNIYLWDDNIMAAPPKVFKKVMDDLRSVNKPFQFRQGMDIRLMNDQKAELLNSVKYHGDFIFAFDHYRMDDAKEKRNVEQILRGLEVWRKHCLKSTKLYVLVGYDSIDEKDIEGTFWRIKKLMEYGCLPYIMRFEAYNDSRFKSMYIQLARWCNQPSFFKKMSFRQYCVRNEEYHQGIQHLTPKGVYNTKLIIPKGYKSRDTYCSCYRTMVAFEAEFPDIAKEYFDLRFEELNPYKISKK